MILTALFHGLIWSLLWSLNILVNENFWPQIYAHDYPKEIQKKAKIEPLTRKQRMGALVFNILSWGMILGYLGYALWQQIATNSSDSIQLFLYCFIIFMVYNLFDLLILDWLIFNKITPDFIVLPGTKGDKAYKNYWFNFIGFLKGILIVLAGAALISQVAFGISRLF